MNKKIAIITDSASDINPKIAKKYNIKVIPLRIIFSSNTYRDKIEINSNKFYSMLKSEIPKTSLPNAKDILYVLDSLVDEGYTDVLYVGLSSNLSGTFNFINMIGSEYTNLKFHSIDTKIASCAQRALVFEALKRINMGKTIDDIKVYITSIRQKMQNFIVIENLTYLKKGGRIPKIAGTMGNLLHVTPILSINSEGIFEFIGKNIGFQRTIDNVLKDIKARFEKAKINVSIGYGKDDRIAKSVLDKIKSFATVCESSIEPVSPVLGSHSGPGLIAIAVYNAY